MLDTEKITQCALRFKQGRLFSLNHISTYDNFDFFFNTDVVDGEGSVVVESHEFMCHFSHCCALS